MKKVQRSVASGLLVLALAFGLTGCGSNHHSSKSATSKDKVTKVSKQKKATASSSKKKQSSKKNSSSDNDSSQINANSNSSVTNSTSSKNSSTSSSVNSQKQLGLGDVATWTDENGVTHHVDSDGMDRQTSPNQQGITYRDWSGSLPSNAQIIHQN